MELKVWRDERVVALASAGSWEDALSATREMGASAPRHIVSDGDKAIEITVNYMTRILRVNCANFTCCVNTSAT